MILYEFQSTFVYEIAIPFFPHFYDAFSYDFRGRGLAFLEQRLYVFDQLCLLLIECISIAFKLTNHTIDDSYLLPQYLLLISWWLLLSSHLYLLLVSHLFCRCFKVNADGSRFYKELI